MKKIKNTFLILAASVMTISLAACGSSSSEKQQTPAADSVPLTGLTLQVMISEEPGEGDALGNALEKWSAATGGIVK